MQQTNYDSEFCGSLPIHQTNLIQPYGVLLVVENLTGTIVQASENTTAIFGKTAQQIVNARIQDFISEKDFADLQQRVNKEFKDKIPVVLSIDKKSLMSIIHRKENHILIEIDLQPLTSANQETFLTIYQELKYVMARIDASASINEASQIAASELKRISGFDKVMIYRFDENWNGTVIAEVKEPEMEGYLGVTFPASDIPRQARNLYLKNPYRYIPNRNFTPVKLYPVINPVSGSFIDLSDCNLRSVPAVHLEYLKNMDVCASMSTRILRDDKLWGLIACHHRTSRYIDYEMCSVFELLSGIISSKIASLDNKESHALESTIKEQYAKLIENIYRTENLEKVVLAPDGAMTLFNATGAVLTKNGKIIKAGSVPSTEYLDDLLLWLHTRSLRKNFSTDSLINEYENAVNFSDTGSGMLVIPINPGRDSYLILFRKEIQKVINWGGNPDERIQFEADHKTYHPRNSFKQWQQQVRGTATPWHSEEMKAAEMFRSFIYEYETTVTS